MTLDNPTSLLSTSDVGSHLEGYRGLLKTLSVAQRRGLVIDAGGFFGDTGYNRLGRGEVERRILADVYDLCLPSVPGFAHYLNDPMVREKSLCANLTRFDGAPVFRPSRRVRVVGIDTLVLGIIGEEEFEALPASERGRMRWHSPARCVRMFADAFARRAMPTRRSAIVVLSHAGTGTDHELAKACPQVSAIVSASGHLEEHSVSRLGVTTMVTPAGHGAGYAVIQPGGSRWEATTMAFPADVPGRPRELLRPLYSRIEEITGTLREPVGALHADFRYTTPRPRRLLTSIAHELVRTIGVDQAVLAESLVRATQLGVSLTRGQLLECTEYDERLVTIELEISSAARLPTSLVPDLGRLVLVGQLPRRGPARLATSAAIAASIGAPVKAEIGALSDLVAKVLTASEDCGAGPTGTRTKRSSTLPSGLLAAPGPAT